jgi:hypothetical protein
MSGQAQQTTGNVRGIVKDPTGAVIPGAKVTITNKQTNFSSNTQSTEAGEFQFNDLLPGDYTITIEATNFKTLTLNEVRVELNQTTDIPAELQVGLQGETVEVSAGGAELVETTTTTLSKSFNERQVVELGQTSVGAGVNNLALIAPNVSSSGGIGVGTGGSVGGQRPRNNNFVLDGVDNNDKAVTGPQVYVSPEVVAEFSLLQNQFSAEFGRSNGGQFITVTKSGTNEFHGSAYGFFRNRHLNAVDTLDKNRGVVRERERVTDANPYFPRSDYGRFGGNIGGPLYLPRFGEGGPTYISGKDRLFFFTSYERLQTGSSAAPGGITAPTAEGRALINSLPGLSPTNLAIFNQYVPVAPVPNGQTITVAGVEIPIGDVTFPAPNFTRQNNFVLNIDFNQSENTRHSARFNYTNFFGIDTGATLPQFYVLTPNKQRLFSYTLFHTFSPRLSNETRLAYRRSVSTFPVPDITFPGLDAFPNIGLLDLSINIGPNPNFPQFGIENNYQIINNTTLTAGNHSLKFGGDFRNIISPQSFVQRERGDYEYNSTDLFLRDISPDSVAERTVGASPYYGNQRVLYAFIQDDWRVRPNLTLNLGLGYSYQEVPKGAKLQALNAIASVPGFLEFREPRSEKNNFAPKVGLAYSPNFDSGLLGKVFGSSGQSSIRAGFSLGYDYIFDNLYILTLPPQANQTRNVDLTAAIPNFLANGGIPNIPTGGLTDPVAARAATSAYIPDQEVPYAITYTLSFQRQFLKDWAFEARYLGTRGVHLLTQNRINARSVVTDTQFLPTYLSAPTQAQLDALTLTLADLEAQSPIVPAYDAAGFNGNFITSYLSNGNSIYHGFSAQLIRRFAQGFQASAAYTWSHLIDDSTAEVFSTVLNPRRPQDFQNWRAERADSALDRRHRFVLASTYDLPFFSSSPNKFVRAMLGGFSFAGTLTFETGPGVTVLSGIDSNLNLDSAADRTIRNPNGTPNTASTVTPLRNSAGQIVAYLADNPNAEYIQAGLGARANSARNTMRLPGINNLDFSIFKNFRLGEVTKIQLRADMFNAFNHPQYIPGSPNTVSPISTTGVSNVNTVGRADFFQPGRVFSNNPRVIQMALRFDF